MNFEMNLNEYSNNEDDDMEGNINGMNENIYRFIIILKLFLFFYQ